MTEEKTKRCEKRSCALSCARLMLVWLTFLAFPRPNSLSSLFLTILVSTAKIV